MKGHLQRLAASAQRESAVHPLVGGIYVNEPRPDADESAIQSVESHMIDTLPSMEETRDAQAKGSAATNERRGAGERQTVVGESLLMAPKSGFETDAESPAPPQRDQSTMPSEREGLTSRATPAQAALEPSRIDPADLETEAIVPVNMRALLQDEAAPERRPDATEPTQSAGPRAGQQSGRRSVEDIQIHIGRIEVIAVAPPTQRWVPASVHKTESLGEYLRRKDRRVR
jgi:hypothetical protein